MALEIEGIVFKILPEQTGEGRNGRWVKQDFIIETQEQFPKKICFSAWGDRTDTLKLLKEREKVKVSFAPESREFNEKWYTDLRAWRIEREGQGSGAQNVSTNQSNERTQSQFEKTVENKVEHTNTFENDTQQNQQEDDLPF